MNESKFLKVAKEAALQAGKVIMNYYGQDHKLRFKSDNSDFVTQADLEAEKTIVEIITKNFSTHNIIAEEKVRIDKKSIYTWAIDPIDGTISFASKMPFFAVSIGLLENNQPIVGVIYHVTPRKLYWAERGKGAFLNGKKISVSKTRHLKDSTAGLGVGSITHRAAKLQDYFYPLLNKVRYIYMLGGGAVTMALVAEGSLDSCPNKAWIWDQAAAGIIIVEAGGKVTDRFNNPVNWSENRTRQVEFIGSNGLLHEEILEALRNS